MKNCSSATAAPISPPRSPCLPGSGEKFADALIDSLKKIHSCETDLPVTAYKQVWAGSTSDAEMGSNAKTQPRTPKPMDGKRKVKNVA